MLIEQYGYNYKVAFITLALCSMMFAESVLAQKTLNKSSTSGGESQISLQVARTFAATKFQQSSNISRTLTPPVAAGALFNKPLTSLSPLRAPGQSSTGFQPVKTWPGWLSHSATLTRAPTLRPILRSTAEGGIQSSFSTQKPSDSRMQAGVSSLIIKRPTISLGSSISSNGTSRINNLISSQWTGSLINNKMASASTAEKQLSISRSSRISSDNIQRIDNLLHREKESLLPTTKINRDGTFFQRFTQRVSNNDTGILSKSTVGEREPAEISRRHQNINLRVVDRLRASSRPEKAVSDNRNNVINNTGSIGDTHVHSVGSVPSQRVAHHDSPYAVRDIHRYEHVYWDRYNRLCHRIIWPRYHFGVYYSHGPYFTFQYVYPYYLRRYIFVSLGGYWPIGYRCIRYYWYGCHPYGWYGYYPMAYEVKGDSYNYYTYNYYYEDDAAAKLGASENIIKPVDHNTFADIREKLARQQTEEPEPETLADRYFDEGVKAFETGDYNIAIEKFAKAIELAPDDMVLPFAYSQALFTNEQYAKAADVLREALVKISPEKEGVFYPRGLYTDDNILFEQIEHLRQQAKLYSFDADLQLLLGYQLLGIGEIDKAIEPLQQASQDMENAPSATILLELVAKMKTDNKSFDPAQDGIENSD